MRVQAGHRPSGKAAKAPHEVSEDIDRMRDDIQDLLGGKPANIVRLSRSRAETRLTIILKGTLEETEERLQRIYKGIKG
ncbi:MAG: hypothetical protein UY11_C0029G0011 [Candidatus Amesbacteria bacterium GW2011_GWC2_47_8]|nr:MAG: hypothetical protein UY11_C0029G0011 [Candidatus Amesbacteria bacterium GW2011_GWC2_47_8]